jgi:hypothetical protein
MCISVIVLMSMVVAEDWIPWDGFFTFDELHHLRKVT